MGRASVKGGYLRSGVCGIVGAVINIVGGVWRAAEGSVNGQSQLLVQRMSWEVLEVRVTSSSVGPPGVIAEEVVVDLQPIGIERTGASLLGPRAGMVFGGWELLLGS